jgi:hypothetical protein
MGRAPEWPHRHGVEKNSWKASKETEWKSRRGAMRRWACKCAFSFSCWFFALRAAVLHFADRRAASAGRPSGLSACVFRGARVSVVRICLFGEKKNKRDCVVATRLTLGTQAKRASQVPRAPDFRVAAQLLQSRREHRSGPAVVAVLGRTAVSGGCRPRTANAAATSRVFALRCLLATLLEGGAALRQRREPTRGHGCALR